MRKLLTILFCALGYLSFGQSPQDTLLGKDKSFLQLSNKRSTHSIDARVAIHYVSVSKGDDIEMINYVVFDDTIAFIQVWKDNTLFGEKSHMLAEYSDSIRVESLQRYFQKKYGLKLNIHDGVSGIVDIKDAFGLACGSDGEPTRLGAEFKSLLNAGLRKEEKLDYLMSIHPVKQLIGYLLLKKSNEGEGLQYMENIAKSQYYLKYCNGCDGSRTVTIQKIIEGTMP